MKNTIRAAIAALALATPVASAQSSNACSAFLTEVDRQEKELAFLQVDGLADNSAPRASYRQQKRSNALALIAINVELMSQNKCPPLSGPVDEFAYILAATACATAELERKPDEIKQKCERQSWQRSR